MDVELVAGDSQPESKAVSISHNFFYCSLSICYGWSAEALRMERNYKFNIKQIPNMEDECGKALAKY
jgi:hypothetical protein